jgi:hypothetical protein
MADVKPLMPAGNAASSVITRRKAADYLQISPAHLSAIIHQQIPGLLPLRHVRVGRRILFRKQWLDDWIDQASLPR